MARKTSPQQAGRKGNDREARLKAALKANMARRKAQALARSAEDGPGMTQDKPPRTGGESR